MWKSKQQKLRNACNLGLDAQHKIQIMYGLYSPCSLTKREEKKVRPQFFKSAIMILLVSVTKHHFTGNQHDAE